jgi:transposase
MGASISEDLRLRVVRAVEGGLSRNAAARHFRVGISSAIRWMQQWEATGHVHVGSSRGTVRSPLKDHRDWLLALVKAEPDLILSEIQERLRNKRQFETSISSLWRFFDRETISFKKNIVRHRAASRSRRKGA